MVIRRHLHLGHLTPGVGRHHIRKGATASGYATTVIHGHQLQLQLILQGHQALHALAIHHYDFGAAVLQAVVQLFRGPPGVHGNGHSAHGKSADERHDPLGIVAAEYRHAIALLYAVVLHQRTTKSRRQSVGLGKAVALVEIYGEGFVPVAEHEAKVLAHVFRCRGEGAVGKTIHRGTIKGEGGALACQFRYSAGQLCQIIAHGYFFPLELD